jgi:uncharacterized protein (DUF736 family)
MAYETKDGQGALFVNEKTAENQPDSKGYIQWNGVRLEVAAWRKTSKGGAKYLSLKVQEPREQNQGGNGSAPAKEEEPDFSDAPF